MIKNFKSLFGSILIKFFLAIIVVSFVFWGIGDIVKNIGTNHAAKVAGKTIPTEEFLKAVEIEKRGIEAQTGEPIKENLIDQVKFFVLDRMINNIVLDNYIKKNNLQISDQKALEVIKNEKVFKNEQGKFDPVKLKEFISRNNLNERKFVDDVQADVSRKMLLDVISSRIVADDIVNLMKQFVNIQYFVSVYKLDINKQNAHYKPSEDEKKAFYEKNKSFFMTDESRDFKYFTIPYNVIKTYIKISEDELKNEYNSRDFKDNTQTFDQMKSKLKTEIEYKKLEELVQAQINKIDDDIASGKTIDEIAERYKGKVKYTENLSKSNQDLSLSIFLREKVLADDNLDEVRVSVNVNDAIYVYKINTINKPYPLDYKDVSNNLAKFLIREHYIKELKNFTETKHANDVIIDKQEYSFKVSDIQDKLPVTIPANVVGDALDRKIGEFSGVHKGLEDVFYVAVLDRAVETDSTIQNEKEVIANLSNSIKNELMWQFVNYLRNEYGNEINKSVFEAKW